MAMRDVTIVSNFLKQLLAPWIHLTRRFNPSSVVVYDTLGWRVRRLRIMLGNLSDKSGIYYSWAYREILRGIFLAQKCKILESTTLLLIVIEFLGLSSLNALLDSLA